MKSRQLTSLLRKSGLVLAFSALTSSPLSAADPAAVLPDESVAYMEMDSAGFYKLESNPVVKAIPVEGLKKIFYKLTGNSPDAIDPNEPPSTNPIDWSSANRAAPS